MGRLLSMDNADAETIKAGNELQIKNGERWSARDWLVFRCSRVEKSESAARKERIAAETKPVNMTARADTLWARKLDPVTARDTQNTRNRERVETVKAEKQRINENIEKWDEQTREVLEGSKWGN